MLDPRRVLTFRAVVEERSFSRAAESLALTQPAVSQQVRALEVQLGERLIDRSRGTFSLTASGRLLAGHADAIADRLRLAEAQLAEARGDERRRLRVGAFPSALATIVPSALAGLTAEQPGLEARVDQGDAATLAARVRDGSLHAALLFQDATLPRREHDGAERLDLAGEPLVAALPARHRLARRRRVELADLAGETWTMPSPDGLIHRACVAAGFEPRIGFLTSDPLAIGALVEAGLAVTLTPLLLTPRLQGVATARLAGTPASRTIYALVPPGKRHPLVDPLLAAVSAALAAQAP
jgi:DNA-binding transcriptional LysR family regulator